jgi:hypothetical protein
LLVDLAQLRQCILIKAHALQVHFIGLPAKPLNDLGRRSSDLIDRLSRIHTVAEIQGNGRGVVGERDKSAARNLRGSRGLQRPLDELPTNPATLVGRLDEEVTQIPEWAVDQAEGESDDLPIVVCNPESVRRIGASERKEGVGAIHNTWGNPEVMTGMQVVDCVRNGGSHGEPILGAARPVADRHRLPLDARDSRRPEVTAAHHTQSQPG